MIQDDSTQARSAMNENSKIQIVSQDMMRRLMNTKEELGAENRGAFVDMYVKKTASGSRPGGYL